MKNLIPYKLAALAMTALLISSTSTANAGTATSLLLDLQPTGGTTESLFEPLEADNQDPSAMASGMYTAFGTNITVDVNTANLPDGAADFRAVTRNGAGGDKENDWIGVDTRNAGVDVVLSVIVSGLPAGDYNWLSTHHDGGSGVTNGNLNGTTDYQFVDAGGAGSVVADGITISEGNVPDPISTLSLGFTSDGSPVSLSMIMDNGQGGTSNALFALINSVEITTIPEPTSVMLVGLGVLGLMASRRRA